MHYSIATVSHEIYQVPYHFGTVNKLELLTAKITKNCRKEREEKLKIKRTQKAPHVSLSGLVQWELCSTRGHFKQH